MTSRAPVPLLHIDLPGSVLMVADKVIAPPSLTYVNGDEPGLTRRRFGKGFSYRDHRDNRVDDAETLQRIRMLAIPPAWTNVWICTDPSGHIQATGRDRRGRKQYRYHPKWTLHRNEAKFGSLTAFARSLPNLRERVNEDLRRRGLPRERVIASIIWLLDNTLIRIGNDTYRKKTKASALPLSSLGIWRFTAPASALRFEVNRAGNGG